MLTLYQHQKDSVARILQCWQRNPVVYDCSDVGTGKTFTAAYAAMYMAESTRAIHVYCPAALIPTWISAFDRLFERQPGLICSLEKAARNPQQVPPANRSKVTIVDEVHRCSGFGSKSAEVFARICASSRYTLGLSATLAYNPVKALPFAGAAGLVDVNSNYRVATYMQQWGCKLTRFGWTYRQESTERMKAFRDWLFAIGAAQFVRVSQEQVAHLFPPGRIDELYLDLGKSSDDYFAPSYAGEDDRAVLVRAHQKVESAKVALVAEIASESAEAGMLPVLFVNFNETRERLHDLTGWPMIHGGTDWDERTSLVEACQMGHLDGLICNIRCGGLGLSLHDTTGRKAHISYIFPCWDPVVMMQAMGRIHRVGGKTLAQQYVVLAGNTIEIPMFRRLNENKTNLSILYDDKNAGDTVPEFVD